MGNDAGGPGGEKEYVWECVNESENGMCSTLCDVRISFLQKYTRALSYLLRLGLESPSKCSTSMSDILVRIVNNNMFRFTQGMQ